MTLNDKRLFGKFFASPAFSLVELLVVIAIIALLTALLLPSLRKAKDAANDSLCKSKERQIGQMAMYYVDDYNGYLPNAHTMVGASWYTWDSALGGYLANNEPSRFKTIYMCPLDRIKRSNSAYGTRSYSMNYWLSHYDYSGATRSRTLKTLQRKASTIPLFVEHWHTDNYQQIAWHNELYYSNYAGWGVPPVFHSGKSNAALVDGHVTSYMPDDLKNLAWDWAGW